MLKDDRVAGDDEDKEKGRMLDDRCSVTNYNARCYKRYGCNTHMPTANMCRTVRTQHDDYDDDVIQVCRL